MKLLCGVLAFLMVVLSGCSKDPVVADLEAFDQLGRSVFLDNGALAGMNQKVIQAKTDEERIAVLDEMTKLMETRAEKMAGFKAKTPEVAKISETFNQGIQQALDGSKRAKAAFKASNQAEMNAAAATMQAGQKMILDAVKEYTRLAKEKGLKVSQ